MALMRVLVVDDDAAVVAAWRDALRQLAEVETVAVHGGESVTDRLEAERFSLLIVGAGTRGPAGRALSEVVREKGAALPLLIVGGDAVDATPADRVDWQQSPFTPEQLAARVARLLAGGRPVQEVAANAPAAGAGASGPPETMGFFDLRQRRVAAFEVEYLANLLTACHGDVVRASREARLPRGTFYRLLKKHQIEPGKFRG